MIKLKEVLITGLKMNSVDETNMLSSTYNKKKIQIQCR